MNWLIKNKVVVFGNSQTAELVKYYLDNDSEFLVSAFFIDANYLKQDSFMVVPIIAFEDVTMLMTSHWASIPPL